MHPFRLLPADMGRLSESHWEKVEDGVANLPNYQGRTLANPHCSIRSLHFYREGSLSYRRDLAWSVCYSDGHPILATHVHQHHVHFRRALPLVRPTQRTREIVDFETNRKAM